jgi:hypothetical protein
MAVGKVIAPLPPREIARSRSWPRGLWTAARESPLLASSKAPND